MCWWCEGGRRLERKVDGVEVGKASAVAVFVVEDDGGGWKADEAGGEGGDLSLFSSLLLLSL